MLTDRQKREKALRREVYGRKLHCTKCDVRMRDHEPLQAQGCFEHPLNGCANAGGTFDWDTPARIENTHRNWKRGWKVKINRYAGIERVVSKKYARARARGAKLASKHRPK